MPGRRLFENEAEERRSEENKKRPHLGRAVVDHDIGAFPDSVVPGPGVGR